MSLTPEQIEVIFREEWTPEWWSIPESQALAQIQEAASVLPDVSRANRIVTQHQNANFELLDKCVRGQLATGNQQRIIRLWTDIAAIQPRWVDNVIYAARAVVAFLVIVTILKAWGLM